MQPQKIPFHITHIRCQLLKLKAIFTMIEVTLYIKLYFLMYGTNKHFLSPRSQNDHLCLSYIPSFVITLFELRRYIYTFLCEKPFF